MKHSTPDKYIPISKKILKLRLSLIGLALLSIGLILIGPVILSDINSGYAQTGGFIYWGGIISLIWLSWILFETRGIKHSYLEFNNTSVTYSLPNILGVQTVKTINFHDIKKIKLITYRKNDSVLIVSYIGNTSIDQDLRIPGYFNLLDIKKIFDKKIPNGNNE